MLHASKMAFVGSGVMGEAMIKGLLTQNLTTPDCIVASDPWQERLDIIQATYGVSVTNDNNSAVVRGADIVVMSIKPQSLPKVGKNCTGYPPGCARVEHPGGHPHRHAAKQAFSRPYRARHAQHASPAEGMTVWTATSQVAGEQLRFTEAILGAMGEQLQVEEESFLDMATGL